MPEAILDLIRLLEQQEALIRRLIALGREEMRALREEDLDALRRLMEEQARCNELLGELERERMALQERLAPDASVAGSATLSRLLAQEGPHRDCLASLAARLRAGYGELRELNELNRQLIRETLAYVNRALAAWRSEDTAYGQGGRAEMAGERASVDTAV